MPRHYIVLVAVATLFCFASVIARSQQAEVQSAPKQTLWEYKIVYHSELETMNQSATDLDKMGREGWELVSVAILDPSVNRRSHHTAYYLKRPLQQ